MNIVILMGRLTRDPEVRYSQGESSTAVANYRLAVDRRFKRDGQPDADFFDCVCFGRQAEFAEKYLHQGTKMVVQGRLQNDNYQGRDGQMVYRNRIIVENQEFAESKAASQQSGGYSNNSYNSGNNNSGSGNSYGGYNSRPSRQSAPAPEPAADGFMNIPDGIDEELPFN